MRIERAVSEWSDKQRSIFKITPEDVLGVAPGAYDMYQDIWTVRRPWGSYLVYRVHVPALYRSRLLYDAVHRASTSTNELMQIWRRIQPKYGFQSPRSIHLFFDVWHPLHGTYFFGRGVPDPVVEKLSISHVVVI
ncbi:hypothetical protein AAVH_10316 [Aphelenchoides avenae]|nr:hypothetical protein AAVH_10316 [Aphelenchus avenae]